MNRNSLPVFVIILIFVIGCAAPRDSSDPVTSAATEHAVRSLEGNEAATQFSQRVEPGMSPASIRTTMAELAEQPSWPDWRSDTEPDDRSFVTENGVSVEGWIYNFYRKSVLLIFKNDELVSFEMETGEGWQRNQNILLDYLN